MQNLFNDYLKKFNEYAQVVSVNYPIVTAKGLPNAVLQELVLFESGVWGQIIKLKQDVVEISLFSKNNVAMSEKVVRTGGLQSVKVDNKILGQIIDPLGFVLGSQELACPEGTEAIIDVPPMPIRERAPVKQSFYTGVSTVDLFLPLGKGQRELVLGNRKTGKSSFLQTVMLEQAKLGSIIVYAAIGKQLSSIKRIDEFIKNNNLEKQVVVVASPPHNSPSLIYFTPFTAMAIGESFVKKGKDVLVILDDLSNHAKFYRQIALVSKQFPGRDSYPGDIFYTHARLLERAGSFKVGDKVATITCLPVAETVDNNLSNYIVSNLISITDGHIMFDESLFTQGRRPAVDIYLSVTRVGKQTQNPLRREITQQLLEFMSKYQKAEHFSHFGAELTEKMKDFLHRGRLLWLMFDQKIEQSISIELQIFLALIVWQDLLPKKWDEKKILEFKSEILKLYYKNDPKLNFFKDILSFKSVIEVTGYIQKNLKNIINYD